MITYDEVLNLNFYKKSSYTGWLKEMRFLIKMETADEDTKQFHVWIWPGPFIFDLTPDDQKKEAFFPFSNEGKEKAVDWINEQYTMHRDLWPKEKLDGFDAR